MIVEDYGLRTTAGRGIPLEGVEVQGEILGGHARVKVRQRYHNAEPKPVEAIYTFPLPSDATLTAFSMTCAGRRLDGVVKEREKAFRDYDEALSAGHGAALLDQERKNVFTAQVGNLLPGELTVVEIEYVQRVAADEGALRWMIPTLVAPRFIPLGPPAGDRTGHGVADPTDRVPDADRITPPIGEDIPYGLTLDLLIDLGRAVRVESPSHAITVTEDGHKARVAFANQTIALDRDVVLLVSGAEGPLETLVAHRADGLGVFALTVVPDLAGESDRKPRAQDAVFVIDTSTSMKGESLPQAQAALRLCLRHLREGDRFNVIAFNDGLRTFQPRLVPFTQKTLEQADRFIDELVAKGGTAILEPLIRAIGQAQDGVVVLLTDGQVGNEEEILLEALERRGSARVYSIGIGTNVSDMLLRDLARHTGGAVEMIHPGERIDEKVVAQFARALAPRVTDVKLRIEGADFDDLAPAAPPALVDGEAWVVYGRYQQPGAGTFVIEGTLDGRRFRREVPFDLPARAERPHLPKLWAAERIRDLEMVNLEGRRAGAMKERILAIALEHGLASPFTSFVVVETRSGDRRAQGQPEARVVPVNVPAGWDMFKTKKRVTMTRGGVQRGRFYASPLSPDGSPLEAAPGRRLGRASSMPPISRGGGESDGSWNDVSALLPVFEAKRGGALRPEPEAPEVALLSRQLASGLWSDGGSGDGERAAATIRALLELVRLGITASHRVYGAQIQKAVEALVALAPRVSALLELALGVAWLAAGRRARRDIAKLPGFPGERDLAARVDDMAAKIGS